jgi:RNA polymerase sigma-70 factor (ECF subfamily)
MNALAEQFAQSRRRLFGLAYRMTGSESEADDILQEAWIRAEQAAGGAEIRAPFAYFKKIVTRVCLDHLKSTQRREAYVGPWLPEPLPDTDGLTPEGAALMADDLSVALLVTLETLSPAERAAFLLRDVFDTPYAEIAEAIGRTEDDCRQLAARARKAVAKQRPPRKVSAAAHQRLVTAFSEAVAQGDAERLKSLLAADAVAYTDGGGVKPAALNPIEGADRIARFYIGLRRKVGRRADGRETKSAAAASGVEIRAAEINGAAGLLVYLDGALDQAVTLATDGVKILAIYAVRNPAKLEAMKQGAPRPPFLEHC